MRRIRPRGGVHWPRTNGVLEENHINRDSDVKSDIVARETTEVGEIRPRCGGPQLYRCLEAMQTSVRQQQVRPGSLHQGNAPGTVPTEKG